MNKWMGFLFMSCLGASGWGAETKEPVKVGEAIPNLTVRDANDKDHSLNDYKGKKGIVLFFIPKADTPG